MDVVLYMHGKGGSASESEIFEPFFPNCDVVGLDYKSNTPWQVREEIRNEIQKLNKKYDNIILLANSIGAYFSMNAGIDNFVQKAFFISPVVDMQKLIYSMMFFANVGEKELQEKGIISTSFGEDLSWEYLSYVKNNPIKWNTKTYILYGENDSLIDMDSILNFEKSHDVELTIMPNGEHWFHTKPQLDFLFNWLKNIMKSETLA